MGTVFYRNHLTRALFLAYPSVSLAETITVIVNFTDTQGIGEKVGVIDLEDEEQD